MRISLSVLAALFLFSGSAASAQTGYDAEASASLEAHIDAMLATMNTGDFSGLRAHSNDVTVFDIGVDGAPIAVHGDEWNARLDALVAQLTGAGSAVTYAVTSRECHATSELGFCTVVYDALFTVGEQTSSSPWRITVVAHASEAGWTTVHFHNSPGQ